MDGNTKATIAKFEMDSLTKNPINNGNNSVEKLFQRNAKK